jgi:hypothetical protein
MLQEVLAGAGFLAAGIPAPGVLAFVALVLAIVQIGPAFLFLPVVVWSWTAMDTTHALIFNDPGRLTGQHPQASADGARPNNADAGDHGRGHRRHNRLGDHRPVLRPNSSLCRVGCDGDGGARGRCPGIQADSPTTALPVACHIARAYHHVAAAAQFDRSAMHMPIG